MWGPIEELRKMSRDERLGYLSFTSDDMTEQIVTYLMYQLDVRVGALDANEELLKEIEFFKDQNKRLKNKASFFRNKIRQQAEQIERMSEKLRGT